MDRLEQLIGKLKEQFEQNAPASQLLITTKQIEAELARAGSRRSETIGTAKVAVVLPSVTKIAEVEEEKKELREEVKKEEPVDISSRTVLKNKKDNWAYDPIADIPTLAHQTDAKKELNDVIGNTAESLNDKLKANVEDLAATLKDTPLRDLKKAIGINDRFVFINELFRGDEAMYERSIKTINNFKILQEAQYWMERELKVKLAWDDDRQITKHFYQLVKRRFS
ncbi:MAG: hypothetical protein JST87_11180 [Bacteroidetes bacterium]|nr:hypothetical protein [Bacteroidota bacterium]